MKYLLLLLLVLPVLLMSLLPSADGETALSNKTVRVQEFDAANGPVVLELFTSQGCSSCPSADALLQELDAKEEDVIALSFHVDYWNYLGWEDPFSSPYFSARQTDYTDVLQARTYTPQLVVNGRQEMIGSRKSEVAAAIKAAAQTPLVYQPTVRLTRGAEAITVNFTLDEAPAGHRVTALLVQPEATSSIKRGENRGRELHHVNVVRAMAHTPAKTQGEFVLRLPDGLSADTARVVLLVQEERTQAIVGVSHED